MIAHVDLSIGLPFGLHTYKSMDLYDVSDLSVDCFFLGTDLSCSHGSHRPPVLRSASHIWYCECLHSVIVSSGKIARNSVHFTSVLFISGIICLATCIQSLPEAAPFRLSHGLLCQVHGKL